MFNREVFSKRFKLLRTTHQLSMLAISELLVLKSTGSISNFETKKMIPSADVLIDITNLFGVSLDWLSGRLNEPYNDQVLLTLEQEHLKCLLDDLAEKDKKYQSVCRWFVSNNSVYTDPNKRAEAYSLPVRANIIFLFCYFQNDVTWLNLQDRPFSNIKNFTDFKKFVYPIFFDFGNKSLNKRRDAAVQKLDVLNKLLVTREVTLPVFDINAINIDDLDSK